MRNREILIEHRKIGGLVKVTAFDVKSMTEICIQGDAAAPKNMLDKNAISRLEYVLKKKGIV